MINATVLNEFCDGHILEPIRNTLIFGVANLLSFASSFVPWLIYALLWGPWATYLHYGVLLAYTFSCGRSYYVCSKYMAKLESDVKQLRGTMMTLLIGDKLYSPTSVALEHAERLAKGAYTEFQWARATSILVDLYGIIWVLSFLVHCQLAVTTLFMLYIAFGFVKFLYRALVSALSETHKFYFPVYPYVLESLNKPFVSGGFETPNLPADVVKKASRMLRQPQKPLVRTKVATSESDSEPEDEPLTRPAHVVVPDEEQMPLQPIVPRPLIHEDKNSDYRRMMKLIQRTKLRTAARKAIEKGYDQDYFNYNTYGLDKADFYSGEGTAEDHETMQDLGYDIDSYDYRMVDFNDSDSVLRFLQSHSEPVVESLKGAPPSNVPKHLFARTRKEEEPTVFSMPQETQQQLSAKISAVEKALASPSNAPGYVARLNSCLKQLKKVHVFESIITPGTTYRKWPQCIILGDGKQIGHGFAVKSRLYFCAHFLKDVSKLSYEIEGKEYTIPMNSITKNDDTDIATSSMQVVGLKSVPVDSFVVGQPGTAVFIDDLISRFSSSGNLKAEDRGDYNSQAGTCGALVVAQGGVVGMHHATNQMENIFVPSSQLTKFFRNPSAATSSSSSTESKIPSDSKRKVSRVSGDKHKSASGGGSSSAEEQDS
jgi:hypothetical protein